MTLFTSREMRRAVLTVVENNAGTLRELRLGSPAQPAYLAELLGAAPTLQTLHAGVERCSPEEALAMLRNEPPYGPLRLHTLVVAPPREPHLIDNAAVMEIAAALPAHASLRNFVLVGADQTSGAAFDLLVDAALAVRLTSLSLQKCFSPAPALARLLRGGVLTHLDLGMCVDVLETSEAAAVLAAALHDTATLTSLTLTRVGLWEAHVPGAALLGR